MTIVEYLHELELDGGLPPTPGGVANVGPAAPPVDTANLKAAVNAGSILSFVDGLSEQEVTDVLYSVQFAIRAADAVADRFQETRIWYETLGDVLQNLGWVTEAFAFTKFDHDEGELKMDAEALKVIGAIAAGSGLAVLKVALDAMKQLADDSRQISLFDFRTSSQASGNYQVGVVQKADNGALSMAFGSFYYKSSDRRRRFLFVSWGRHEVNFWTSAQKMTLNRAYYANVRGIVESRLGNEGAQNIAAIPIA